MTVLTDAELLIGLSRHLVAYQMSPERAALEQLEFAGQVFDMAFRLRGSTTSSAQRVQAIALDAKLGPLRLKEVMATLEQLRWLTVTRNRDGTPLSVTETIPPPARLIEAAGDLMHILMVTPVARAALVILRSTTLQPLTLDDAIATAVDTGGVDGEECARSAVRHLTHVGLVRRVRSEDGREVLYNPNVWVQGDSVAQAALKAADANATSRVTALLEEVTRNPGIPEAHVQSTEPKWIKFAVSQGLVQRSVIQTSEGAEQAFLFSPHLARDPFGATVGDVSGQVRQLVGSMIYATTFARYKLDDPAAFVRALISRGVAGNVSNIKTDYPMLEKAGIVRVVSGWTQGRYALELLQSEVAEDALRFLDSRAGSADDSLDAAAIRAQQSYVHIETDRAQLALSTTVDEIEQARLIAALREQTSRRTMGGRG